MICKINKIKNSFSVIILLMFWLSVNFVQAQSGNAITEEKTKANEILQKSRKAIGLEAEKQKVSKISLNYNFSSFTKQLIIEKKEERTKQGNGKKEFHTMLPNSFRYSESINLDDTLWISNFTLAGNLLDEESYGMSEGKRYENEPQGLAKSSKEQAIRDKKEDIFFMLFPVLLESKDFFPLDFKSVGKADINGEKADVLEVILSEESKTRLFFDEQTHLLKMIITNSKLPNGAEIEEKRFYSDYKAVDGLMIAHKVNIDMKQSHKRLKSEKVEEQILKSAKINPTFKPNFFEVKKK